MQFLALRKHTPEERLAIVECAIYHTDRLGLVIIDGIRDLVYDINSPVEATTVISKLMQWTDERQLHLHTVLHQNKSDDNARGHIGTELNNKAETVIQIENVCANERRAEHSSSYAECSQTSRKQRPTGQGHQCGAVGVHPRHGLRRLRLPRER